MPFFIFELIFAALLLGLLVVAFMIVRQIRHDRQAKADPRPPGVERKAAKPRLPGLRRKPEPEPEPEPPIVRKRQLRSLSEVEREAAEGAEGARETAPGPAAPVVAAIPNFSQRVLARLEAAFERLQAEEISLDAYVAQVRAEQAEVDQRIDALRAVGNSPDLDEALKARESVQWCLDWADEQRGGQPGPA